MKVLESRLLVVGPGEGKSVTLGALGVDFKIWGHETGGRFAIVEHPIQARCLVPPHTHSMEDELSYVLEGRVGVRVGDDVAEAGPGTYIYKPCGEHEEIAARYHESHFMDWVSELKARYGLKLLGES